MSWLTFGYGIVVGMLVGGSISAIVIALLVAHGQREKRAEDIRVEVKP